MFFLTGIILMAASVTLAVICMILFIVKKRKLKNVLEQEYGKPRH